MSNTQVGAADGRTQFSKPIAGTDTCCQSSVTTALTERLGSAKTLTEAR